MSMTVKQETFASLMSSFSYHYNLPQVFEDFLTISMCVVTQIPGEGKSHYEEQYLQTIEKYKDDEQRHQFPKLFAALILEMEDRVDSSQGNDVLGDFYMQGFGNKKAGQFFTPWHICDFMAEINNAEPMEGKILRILDPCCGSGRMVLASAKKLGPQHEYYAIDLDHTCVKMTALNLFFNGVFNSEVMWADALMSDDFRLSYKISLFPMGIFRIEQREQSKLWHLNRNSFQAATNAKASEQSKPAAPQLKLF
ncbi:MAG TPA: N-6 DNA methylase [Sphingobacteriaceae bacterium]